MIESIPSSPPNSSALDEDVIEALDAQQTDTIHTPEMQERVRCGLMQRVEQDALCRSMRMPLNRAKRLHPSSGAL